MTDPIGPIRAALVGRYEIERKIGEGAFATVYLARDLRHDRLVAFKVMNADPTSQDSELRFLREIRLLAKLQHPNIVPLIDSGHAGATLYYVMPYVQGESLRERVSASDNCRSTPRVSLDDQRFLMIRPLPASGPDQLIVVENWFEELKAKSRK